MDDESPKRAVSGRCGRLIIFTALEPAGGIHAAKMANTLRHLWSNAPVTGLAFALSSKINGRHELRAGMLDGHAEAREWCSLFMHDLVFSTVPRRHFAITFAA